jgi:aromatic-L-amino-acid/L-tryptophan decarboxylase
VPLRLEGTEPEKERYLNELNEKIVNGLQLGGKVFLSNAIVGNKYCLRACIVNFRTTHQDIHEAIDLIVQEGRRISEKGT